MRLFKLGFACVLMFLLIVSCSQQPKDFVYTTDSAQALDHFTRGLAELDMLQLNNARTLLDQALEADPKFAMAHFYRAQTATTGDDFRNHLALAMQYKDGATEPEQLAIMQMQANSEDNTAEARIYLEKLVQLLPESRRAHYLMGIFYFGQQEWANAEREFFKITELDPKFAPVYNMLAYAYSNQMKYPEAIDALKTYASLRPDDPNPYDSMGEIYLHSGNYENSIKAYETSLEKDPNFNASHAGLGHNYCFTKKFDKALENYRAFLTNARSVADTNVYFFWSATAYVHQDKLDKAIKTLREQIEFAMARDQIANAGGVHQQLALIYIQRGDYKKALAEAAVERELAKNPKLQKAASEGLIRAVDAVEARVYASQGKMDEAVERLEKFRLSAEASGNEVNMLNYHGLAGLTYLAGGDIDKALEHFAMANPQNMYQQYYHAMALEKADRNEEARSLFKKVAHWNRNNMVYAMVRDDAMMRM